MKNKVMAIFVVVFFLIGCGSSDKTPSGAGSESGSDSGSISVNGGSSSTIFGTGTYTDSPINGVRYECGSKTGITGATGVPGGFSYEIGKSCMFKINNTNLTVVAAAGLSGDVVSVHPNLKVARYLQSLDIDGNPDNNIDIHPDVVKALANKGIIGLQQTDTQVQAMVTALGDVSVYDGSFKTMAEAADHMTGFSVQITADKTTYRAGDDVILTANVTGSSAGLSYAWSEGSSPLGSTQQIMISNLSQGPHTIKLAVTNANDIVLNYSIIITIGATDNHTVSISSSTTSYSSDTDVTLTANVTGAEGTVSYLWKDGINTIGTNSQTVTKKFAPGSHTVSVTASANNFSKTNSITFIVSDASNTPPVANAGADIYNIGYETMFTLDGSGSTDVDGNNTIVRYQWRMLSGHIMHDSELPSYEENATIFGDITVILEVFDDKGASSTDTVIVHILEP